MYYKRSEDIAFLSKDEGVLKEFLEVVESLAKEKNVDVVPVEEIIRFHPEDYDDRVKRIRREEIIANFMQENPSFKKEDDVLNFAVNYLVHEKKSLRELEEEHIGLTVGDLVELQESISRMLRTLNEKVEEAVTLTHLMVIEQFELDE